MKKLFPIAFLTIIAAALFSFQTSAADDTVYRVTYECNEPDAIVTIVPEEAKEGELVKIFAEPLLGKRAKTATYESDVKSGKCYGRTVGEFHLTMPAADTVVNIQYISVSSDNRKVTISEKNQEFLEVEKQSYLPGETVEVITHANEDRAVGVVNVIKADTYNALDWEEFNATKEGNGVFSFVMPDHDVVLEPGFVKPDKDTVIDLKAYYRVYVGIDSDEATLEMPVKSAARGDYVSFRVIPKDGFMIGEIEAKDEKTGEDIDIDYNEILDKYTFKMPGSDVGLEIETKIAPKNTRHSIALTYNEDLGEVEISESIAKYGDKIYIYIDSHSSAVLDSIRITSEANGSAVRLDEDDDGEYYFIMPSSEVSVYVKFEEKSLPVDEEDDEGITAKEETEDESFEGDEPDETEYETDASQTQDTPTVHICPSKAYIDVDTEAWYHEAVDYVITAGLMGGYSENTFAPADTTTRAMIATVIWRMEGAPVSTARNPFSDVREDMWYTEAVNWAAEKGIVNGVGGDLFDPDGVITREQLAVMLYRYSEYKGKDILYDTQGFDFADSADMSDWAINALVWCSNRGMIYIREGLLLPKHPAERAEVAFAVFGASK